MAALGKLWFAYNLSISDEYAERGIFVIIVLCKRATTYIGYPDNCDGQGLFALLDTGTVEQDIQSGNVNFYVENIC
ncbi:hypothetical protein ACFL5S_01075 [Fibrobacterota bacterium]